MDLGAASEFQKGHIEGAEHIYVGKLTQNLDQISKDKPVIIHCQSGARSAIGYSILAAHGFDNVLNYAGGWAECSVIVNELVSSEKQVHAPQIQKGIGIQYRGQMTEICNLRDIPGIENPK